MENEKMNREMLGMENIEDSLGSVSSEPCLSTTPRSTHFVRRQKKDLRDKVIPVRFSEAEYAQLKSAVIHFKISLSSLIRRKCLNLRLPNVTHSQLTRDFYRELCAIGNNLNQLTKTIHLGQMSEINRSLFEELLSLLKKINMKLIAGD